MRAFKDRTIPWFNLDLFTTMRALNQHRREHPPRAVRKYSRYWLEQSSRLFQQEEEYRNSEDLQKSWGWNEVGRGPFSSSS